MEDYLPTYSKSSNNLAQISLAINDWQHLSVSHPSPYDMNPSLLSHPYTALRHEYFYLYCSNLTRNEIGLAADFGRKMAQSLVF